MEEDGGALAAGDVETCSFATVVQGREPFEISRLFLASLQLANSGNLDFGHKGSGRVCSLHDLQFRLLTETHAHETFAENHAAAAGAKKAIATPSARAPLAAMN